MEAKNTIIFISYSACDESLGEKLLDVLIELGIDSSNVFYSSKYHNGVKLGNNFHDSVKNAITQSEVVVFLLTKNFYNSEYCLNEMGAAWYANKTIIPILLDGLSYSDMKGFIDSHYIALKPSEDQAFKLFSELKPYISSKNSDGDAEKAFREFIATADKIESSVVPTAPAMKSLSDAEMLLLENKLTDNEVLFINYFIEKTTFELLDYTIGGYGEEPTPTKELMEFRQYTECYNNFNYETAKRLLEKSGILICRNSQTTDDWNEEYCGCELQIDFFRNIISLSNDGKQYIETVKARHRNSCAVITEDGQTQQLNKLERLIVNKRRKEIDVLLFAYIENTGDYHLGDRWMSEQTIIKIRQWETEKSLFKRKLSSNYLLALRAFEDMGLLDIVSCTSYGNPREYKLKKEYIEMIENLNDSINNYLIKVVEQNIIDENDDLPF